MDIVELSCLHVHAEVGFGRHEIGRQQELNIIIHLKTSIKKAGETDRVEDTINYKTITKDVLFHVENKKFNLIEAVATDVARICVVRHRIHSVRVAVEKPNSLRFCESSSVIIERSWEDFDWQEAHIMLGSNLDPLFKLSQALTLLSENPGVRVVRVSKAFWTKPVMTDEPANDFVNMAALVKTKLDVEGLKLVLLNIEHQLDRVRKPSSNTYAIDMDISFYGSDVKEYMVNCAPLSKLRVVPHPETLTEAHVIVSLADVPPKFVHPQNKKTLKMLAQEISGTEDFCSLFSIVQENGFLEMAANWAEDYPEKNYSHPLKEDLPSYPKAFLNGTLHCNREAQETNKPTFNQAKDIPTLKESKPLTAPSQANFSCHGNEFVSLDAPKSDSVDQPQYWVGCNGIPVANTTSPVALVTGAAKRLGACIARKLHTAGYRVIIHYNKSKNEANDLLTELNSVRRNSAALVQGDLACDVSKTAQRIITEAVGVWGQLNVLVNNASQFHPTHLGSVSEMDWSNLMQTNLTSPFFLSQAAYSFLKASNGNIVNLCDIHAVRPKSEYSVYCISKAGLHMATFSLAKEFAPNVRVNGVAPGCILWPEESWEGLSAEEKDERTKQSAMKHQESLSKVPFGRTGKPDDIGNAVLFLCRSSDYITGQIIAVDGGRSLHQ